MVGCPAFFLIYFSYSILVYGQENINVDLFIF